jgi:predicted enzyme related to lactoylglutathione lyase
MQRTTLLVSFVGATLAAALAACGSGSKASDTTTPVAEAPAQPAEPAQPAQPAEPAQPPAPPAPTYLHGKWVWFELRSTDVEKSKAFYSQLLGWQIDPQEMGGTKFELVKAHGKDVAIISPTQGKAKSHWIPFVSVPDVDATVKAIEEQKGKVVMPANDIPDIGRFAIVADPNGAEFAVFKGVKGDEPDAPPAPGLFVWNEYLSKNKKQHQAALAFYPATLGYVSSQMQMGEGKKKSSYDMLSVKGEGGQDMPRAGVQAAKPASLGGQWLPWVTVEDTDAIVALTKKLKGKVLSKPHDIPSVGRAAIVADPTGGAIGVLKPAMPEQPGSQPAQPDASKAGAQGAPAAGTKEEKDAARDASKPAEAGPKK